MALTTCPDCQTSISDAAPACPRCGRPMGFAAPALTRPQVVVARRAGAPWEAGGAGLMLLGTVIGIPSCVAASGAGIGIGALMGVGGLLVFMVGRFID